MKINDWFTSHLDDHQRRIVAINMDQSFIVQGPAGSGKTILALHRASQANLFGSFAILVYTKALKNMIQFGLKVLDLPPDRVVYEWSWLNRGIELLGDIYVKKLPTSQGYINHNSNNIYLKRDDGKVEEFEFWNTESNAHKLTELYNEIANGRNLYTAEQIKNKEEELNQFVTIDFANYVSYSLYSAFGRRSRWYRRKGIYDHFDLSSSLYEFVPSAELYRKKTPVEYIIVDEAQDFSLPTLRQFTNSALKSSVLLGDSLQQVYSDKGTSLDEIESGMQLKRFFLGHNYRLPKSVAKVAQKVSSKEQDLITNNMRNNGNSDFPVFPKPILKKCDNANEELDFIFNKIKVEGLDDVGILVPTEDLVKLVYKYMQDKGVETQVKFKEFFSTGIFDMFTQTDTLNFTDPNNPSILTYHSAKGTQFENVFLPFSSGNIDRNPYYVAMTRTSRRLFISYTNTITPLLQNIPRNYFDTQ